EAQGIAQLVGGARYVMELANATPSAANIAAYAEIVREKAVMRALIDAGNGFKPEGRSAQELVESAEQRVFRIAEGSARGRQRFATMREAVKDAFRLLQERYENRQAVTGCRPGSSTSTTRPRGSSPAT